MKRLARACGAAALALLLAACVKADVNLTVRDDDRIYGTIVMAVDRSFLPSDAVAADAAVAEVRRRTFEGTPSGARREAYADDRYVGSRVTIAEMSLLDFDRGTADDGLKIVHQGDRFRLTGTVDTLGMAPADPQTASANVRRMMESFHVSVRVTFPGRVISSNGAATGSTVTWSPRLGERLELAAEAEDGAGLDRRWPVIVPVALGAAAALALALWLSARRRRADHVRSA